jgi:hypothetical protein
VAEESMKNNCFLKCIVTGICLLSLLGCSSSAGSIHNYNATASAEPKATKSATEKPKSTETTAAQTETPKPTEIPICDGVSVTSGCQVDGVMYSKYVYHPAVPEQSHVESVPTTETVQTGACTLCKDGTFSPTCATGRGACSHHGGVAKWNAPVYRDQTTTTEQKVVDSPAVAEYYETVKQ